MTIVVGITGGVGSGKSTLSTHLKRCGYSVHDSDEEVSLIYKHPTQKFKKILIKVGLKKAIKKTHINKKIIIKKFFEDTKIKKTIEKYLHSEVKKRRNIFIKKQKAKKKDVVFLDIPLLFEKKLDFLFNKIICVVSNKKERQKRIKKSKSISKNIFSEIIKNQTTDKERKKRADYLITNNGVKKNFIIKADRVIKDILK
tara:strand:- start:957 stop:1553 length:597 start_codon:yes stop_codon:yes gene_type:complete